MKCALALRLPRRSYVKNRLLIAAPFFFCVYRCRPQVDPVIGKAPDRQPRLIKIWRLPSEGLKEPLPNDDVHPKASLLGLGARRLRLIEFQDVLGASRYLPRLIAFVV